VIKEESLDKDVCSCCPTAVVKTARGLVVAYRDYTPEDIRDIAVIRLENDRWTPSKIVNPDKWKINACPINAASVSAKGDRVAIAWFTGAQNMPRVQMVFSSDGGSTFSKPLLVSTGHAFGYTSVALEEAGGATSLGSSKGVRGRVCWRVKSRQRAPWGQRSRLLKARGRAWDIRGSYRPAMKPGSRGVRRLRRCKRPA